MNDIQAILRVLSDQEDAISRGEAAAVVAAMAGDVVSFDLPPPLENRGAGPEAVEALEQWFTTWENGVTQQFRDPQVLVDGDLAVVFGLSRMRGTKVGDGAMDNWFRRTVALQRRDGAWKIVHDHSSFPMKMDGSAQAATDLKPQGGT